MCIARLLAEEVIPLVGVPEALLSDRGTNLLSHLMRDVCEMLGIKKLNTTAYHPQCDGMVERFNCTLKTILRKHAAKFGNQWDRYLPGVLWAYRNTPHESTGEKPSFLLFGIDCRTPTEAAYLPPSSVHPADVNDYREELMLSLSSAREIAAASIQKAQERYKKSYDQNINCGDTPFRVGEWVLVRFPQDETGGNRKLSRPWHGPYRVVTQTDPDVCVDKVYFPQDGRIRVHQSRVKTCPPNFPAGFYWYGGRRRSPGRPPKWVTSMMSQRLHDNVSSQVHTEVVNPSSDSSGAQDTESCDSSAVTHCEESHSGRAVGEANSRNTEHTCKYPLRNRLRRTF